MEQCIGQGAKAKIGKQAWIVLIIFLIGSIVVHLCIHQWDNKYRYNVEEQPVCGVLSLSAGQLSKQAYYLCEDWEFYQGVLLAPEAFGGAKTGTGAGAGVRVGVEDGTGAEDKAGAPDAYVRIGQYAGFELDDPEGAPHGSATYRMRLILPETKGNYMLELPEIFSAYQLWVNGRLLVQCGDPRPEQYKAEVAYTQVSFEAQGETELILAVSDFSHYYSGMVYPPAFGTKMQVSRLVFGRLAFSSIACFLALLMFLCCMVFYLNYRGDQKKLSFALVCLGYLGHCSYYLIHTFLPSGNFLWYRLEDFSLLFLLVFLCRLVGEMGRAEKGSKMSWVMTGAGGLMMLLCLMLPRGLEQGSLQGMLFYGGLLDGYKLAVVGYLLICGSSMVVRHKVGAQTLLCGILFFGTGLGFDRLDPTYEPVLLGWGVEYAGFVLLFILGSTLVKESLSAQRMNRELVENEQRKMRYMEEVVHDLKSPLATITTYAELSRMGIAQTKQQQETFLLEIEDRAKELGERIQKLRRLDFGKTQDLQCSCVSSITFLREMVEKYNVLLMQKGIDLRAEGEDFMIYIDKEQMGLALENLIMNGLRYTPEGGSVLLSAHIRQGKKQLAVSDTGKGMDTHYLNAVLSRGVTGDATEHDGLGLYIVSQVARAHGGSVSVKSKQGEGSCFMIELGQDKNL